MKITEWIWWKALKNIFLSFCLTDYPHKYGSEGGCADHSVFERMKKYQASAEEPARVSVIKNKRTRTDKHRQTRLVILHELISTLPYTVSVWPYLKWQYKLFSPGKFLGDKNVGLFSKPEMRLFPQTPLNYAIDNKHNVTFSVQDVTRMLEDEESKDTPVILRKKRATVKEKNTCQLYIQTDHFFFKRYGSKEAVLAQVWGNAVCEIFVFFSFFFYLKKPVLLICWLALAHTPSLVLAAASQWLHAGLPNQNISVESDFWANLLLLHPDIRF